MDSIWYKAKDSIVYTTKSYVGINSDLTLIKPQANLQVNGSLLIQGKFEYSNSAPTAAQVYTMNNTASQTIPADSVFRIYDPGGTSNYNNGMQGNIVTQSLSNQTGIKVISTAADFGFGTGDTLWISNFGFPDCRTEYMYRFTNTQVNPEDFIIPANSTATARFNFRSNSDGVNGKGFNFLLTRLVTKNASKQIQTAGPSLYFNTSNGSFAAGNNAEASDSAIALGTAVKAYGTASTAFGLNTRALGNYSLAGGSITKATGSYSIAMGYYSEATGPFSFAGGFASNASGGNSIAYGEYCAATADYSVALGINNYASGRESISLGYYTQASGAAALAANIYTEASGNGATALGYETIAAGYAGTVVGVYNHAAVLAPQTSIASTTPLFIVGNGDNLSARKNAMIVLKNGDVGIGIGSSVLPEDRLHVAGGNMLLDNSSNTTFQLQAGGVEKGFLQLSGNNIRVGAYSTNSTGVFIVRLNGGDRFTVFPSGNATLDGTLTQSSDARFKKDIQPLSNSLNNIMRLQGYRYRWNAELNKDTAMQIGLIAQNVESVLPELVITAENGMKSVAYQNLVPVLIEAIKDQQQQIEELKKRLTKVEKID